jgi:PAS domain S-box-containing protein
MISELRKTGISIVGDAPWGTHFCHFYETKQDLLDTLVPYFKAGLESKEFCLWVVSNSDLLTVEEAKAALEQAVPDLDRHLSDGNIEILNGHDWYFENNVLKLERVTSAWDAKLKKALALGYDGLRASADTFWLADKDWKDFCHYEKQVDNWIINQPMTVLCTYPLAKSGATAVLDVVQSHQFAIARRQGEWEFVESTELMQAKREIKRLNEVLEQRVIERTGELAAANEELRREISERKRTEEALRKQKEVLQKIFDHIPVMIAFFDENGFIKLLNGEWERTLGWSLEEIQEQNLDVFAELYPDPRERAEVLNFIAAANGEWAEFKFRVRDGRVIGTTWANVRLSDGTTIGIGQDITERKQAENELREQKETLQKIFDHSPMLISFFGEDGRLKLVNREWERTIGWTLEEIEAQNLDVLVECYPDPRDRRKALEFIAAANGEWGDFKVRARDGRVIGTTWANVRLSDGTSVGIGQDITERKRAEEALQLSEERFAKAFHSNPDPVSIIRQSDSIILEINDRWESVFGYIREEVIGRTAAELNLYVNPDDRLKLRDLFKEQGFLREQETACLGKYGDVCHISMSAELIVISDEPCIIFLMRDITQAKRAEEALRQAEEKYHGIFEHAIEGIFQTTPDGQYITANPAMARMLGYDSPQELISSRTDIGQQQYVAPERRSDFKRLLEEHSVVQGFEYQAYRKDGSKIWVSDNVRVVRDESGAVLYYEGFTEDITEQKRAEEGLKQSEREYRGLFENAHDAIIIFNPVEEIVLEVNQRACEIYGFSRSEFIGMSLKTLSKDVKHGVLQIKETLERGTFYNFETIQHRRDGTEMFLDINASLVEYKGQWAIQSINRDITERKQAEEQLKATSEHLRALSARFQSAREEEGTRIAREIHDELGAALSSLRWDLEEVEEVIAGSGEQPRLQELRKKIAAMMRLTDTTVNSVRRIASELRPTALDTLGLVEAIQLQAEQFQERTGIIVQCDCSLEKMYLTPEQSTAIFRIYQEALTNILRHAQATRVEVSTEEEGSFVLRISDNGRGITEDEKTSQHTLGLLGMRERAHLIGGQIDIKGVDGKGTVVTVRIPIS